jgi:hypothetical protein
MAFMNLYTRHGKWFTVTSTNGESTLLTDDWLGANPTLDDFADYVESGEPAEFEEETGWGARYSAPGYMDATDWVGVYPTEEQARDEAVSIYGDEEDDENEA